jgi:C4-dicarboxylate-specific signal transduction histidine kinase
LPQNFATEDKLPWSQAKVLRGEVICFSSVDDLPPEATPDVEMFRLHGPKSNLTFPLVANGRVFGALAFATLEAERTWHPDEVTELKLIAQIIGNVVGRQRAELREEELRNELAHAMRIASLGELVAALTHELNQPLAAILSNAQAARRFINDGGIAPEEIRAILDDIIRDDKRAGGVIHNLRSMVSKRPTIREACCVNELVREVIDLMRSEMIEAKIGTQLVLTPGLPCVEAARVELQQVLVNFLLNAVHAMKDTPTELRFITVETRLEGEAAIVVVRDHGHGIPPERLPAIFEPFFSTKPCGLGMGLSICRRIIENHAGRIEARNRQEGGAAFSISLPATVT